MSDGTEFLITPQDTPKEAPAIVAGTYEVQERIGSGGAGIVYLARHTRLDKKVVLKADKRTVDAKPEALRWEVDALKNLSHTYIPQVYDYIIEDQTAYTVMDFIEGESLDKPLKRGERFSQADVIRWACQLLDALRYLHTRPPHGILHSDIKPANVMLTPEGDIRLIDFNIALALGAEGSVRVGFSHGYASPEHYGLDLTGYTGGTDILTGTTDSVSAGQRRVSASGTGKKKGEKLLDVRSDIYSLGATLYHILTGVRPEADARKVIPIRDPAVSPAVSAIIQKAMNPDPNLRYQSAQEMLDAFASLHTSDPRARRHRKCCTLAAILCGVVFLAGGAMALAGQSQMQRAEAAARQEAEILAEQEREEAEIQRIAREKAANERSALSAVTASESALSEGDRREAIDKALEALSYESSYAARAQKALTDALEVYDLSAGYGQQMLLELPSNPLKLALSPSGACLAVFTSGTLFLFDTASGEQIASLAADTSALCDVVFGGEDTVYYIAPTGLCAYSLAARSQLWSGAVATSISLSADGSAIATVNKSDGCAILYDAATGQQKQVVDFRGHQQYTIYNTNFADRGGRLFALNGDGTKLAVSFEGGALWSFDLRNSDLDVEILDQSEYVSFAGGFQGPYLAVSATDSQSSSSLFWILDLDALAQVAALGSSLPFTVQADESGIFVLQDNYVVQIVDVASASDRQVAAAAKGISAFLVDDGRTMAVDTAGTLYFFDSDGAELDTYENAVPPALLAMAGGVAAAADPDTPQVRLYQYHDHSGVQLFSYDASVQHSEARVNSNGSTVMLFNVNHFLLYTMDGALLAETAMENPGYIYDQEYRRGEDGDFLEVVYYDGTHRYYSAADGALLSEEMGDAPDASLLEEFLTDDWRIVRPLQEAPEVYDRETGAFLRRLEIEDYLIYVTQTGDYVVTEYMTAGGERYGLLLGSDGETLARLPDLCDILPDGTLVFDDQRGVLRQSPIYTLAELRALAGIS